MADESIHSASDFGPNYEFLPVADWWKSGDSYEEAVNRNESPTSPESALEREFNERADRWERESAIHSSPGATYLFRDYIAIIGTGIIAPKTIVPLILRRIPTSGAEWFFALQTIAGENIASGSETFEEAYAKWCNWANQKGFVEH